VNPLEDPVKKAAIEKAKASGESVEAVEAEFEEQDARKDLKSVLQDYKSLK
jgi:hypothetical protein